MLRFAACLCAFALACAGTFSQPIHAQIFGTDAADGSTSLTLPGYEATRMVSVLGVDDITKSIGHVDLVSLTTAPNTSGKIEVNAHDRRRGEIGPTWTTSIGVAAVVAARMLDADLLDFVFTAETAGKLDGPSASGLITAGFLAAATGADIAKDVTMTGTINPDGTIGPVGGIPEKFAAALKTGKRRLGFPVGMRMAKSEATGQLVDIVKLAADGGGEAVELTDVYQAYHLLTGKDLPRAVPVAEQDMRLDAAPAAKLGELSDARRQAMAQRLAFVAQLEADPQMPDTIHKLAARARADLASSARLREGGRPAASHAAMAYAWQDALAASTLHAVVTKTLSGDAAGAIAAIDAVTALAGADRAMFDAIAAAPVSTLAGQLQAVQAARVALQGWNGAAATTTRLDKAKAFLRAHAGSAARADDVIAAVEPAVLTLCTRAKDFALAKDWLVLATADGGPAASPASLARSATALQAASAAAIAYFDRLILPGFAKSAKVSELDEEESFAARHPDYLFAHFADRLATDRFAAELERAWGDRSPAWLLLSLAGAELGYTTSSTLVAEIYALRIHGEQVEREAAFAAMLDAAERTARASARAARIATGAIPLPAKVAYEQAAGYREGSTRDKLAALSLYWTASQYSQTAIMLARHH